ncbi:MAG: Single-stranded DNA-binding protein, partial [uncultured Pseudonocardia sp.]
GRRDRHHRGRQPDRRPRAAVHPVGRRGRQLHRGRHAAHLRPPVRRVEGRRRAVHALQRVAPGGGERRRDPHPRHARDGVGAAAPAQLRDPRGREAHRRGAGGRRGRPLAQVRHRQGQQGQPRQRRRWLRRRRRGRRSPWRRQRRLRWGRRLRRPVELGSAGRQRPGGRRRAPLL